MRLLHLPQQLEEGFRLIDGGRSIMESMGWTEEHIELLKKLWLEGLSASQIAGVLGEGVTRNAVSGKVHRLKLTGRAKPASSAPRARATPRAPGIRRVSTGGGASRPRSGFASMMKSRSMPGGGGGMTHGATALKMDPEFETEAYIAPQVQELFIPEGRRRGRRRRGGRAGGGPGGGPRAPGV